MPLAVFGHLLERRVPQIAGLYLGASWVVVEFVTLLVDRFALSPHLIEFSIVSLGLLIPTVVLLAYHHGKPGRQDWATAEKIGIPLNLLVAAVVILFLFSDRPLGATTTTVTLETEQGNTIERAVPRSEFRKKALLFGFENQSGDTTLDWLQLGLRIGLLLDLDQDFYLQVESEGRLQASLDRAGYPGGVGLGVPLMASLARELHLDHFIFGSFTEVNGELSVTVSLYETRRQRQMAEHTFAGADALRLVDKMSVQLRRDLGVPERHIEETTDLPVSSIISDYPDAFRHVSVAISEMLSYNDWGAARDHLERAVAVDPASVLALHELSVAYLVLNEREKADSVSQLTLRYLYKLPESWQYDVRYFYHENFEPDAEQRLRIAETKVRLFPDDIESHEMLVREYQRRNRTDELVAEYLQILELDPSRYEYLGQIGGVYHRRGEFERALEYYERYAEAAPSDYSAFQALGTIHAALGEHERARSYFEQSRVLDPDNVWVMGDLAAALFNLGRFEESLRQFQEALQTAISPLDRASAHARLSTHYNLLGQLGRAIEHKELEWAELERQYPSAAVAFRKVSSLDLFAAAGDEERAFEVLRRAEAELTAPFSRSIPVGYLNVYLELGDADNAERALADVEAYVDEQETESQRALVLHAEGRIREMRGEYEEAIASYRRALALDATGTYVKRRIASCYRQLERLEEAEAYLQEHLKVTPYNPMAHHELALVYADMGDRDKALEHLRIALTIWSDADPGFQPAREARAKLAELESV
ncbi:MAG: tetratricopeptide repeat protein [Gemmatimonadota bacterium]|nr:MAG: tetratricopeptide repeat protein [Gemmatimonadota bacterium]